MRSTIIRSVAALALASLPQSRSAEAADDDRMPAIIAAVRAEEAKYRDIEYYVTITTRTADPTTPDLPGAVTSEERRRVVLLGDRVYFWCETDAKVSDTERHKEEVSAYDGERSRTVIEGNCANIHLGRFEHPDVYPPHTLMLAHYRVNFPLSTYLSGTEAIHAHPKYGNFMRESGTVYEFTKVETELAGEEQLSGLRCLKIRCKRWHYSKDAPVIQDLWLAPERNYLCVRESLRLGNADFGDLPMHEMSAEALREIAPGVWFPIKVTVINYDGAALRQKRQVVSGRTETVVKKVTLNPRYDVAFFRDIEIPPDLLVFTIKDGSLVDSSLPEPIADEAAEKAKLEEVVAKVREEERRYSDLEVKARDVYRHVGSDHLRDGTITVQAYAEHSVLHGALAYFTRRGLYTTFGGPRSEQDEMQAYDGKWTRGFHRTTQDNSPERRYASLRKGGGGKAEGRNYGVPVLRPHNFLVRENWLYGPLADLLVSPWLDKINGFRLRFRYCGEENVDGHLCVRLRGEVTTREGDPPQSYMAFWLAKDRNYIPIKLEHYGGNFGLRPMPAGISRSSDFREIAPGCWYPFRSTLASFDNWVGMAQRRITLNWRRDYEVDEVKLSPATDAHLFHDVVLPAGTKVQVSDEDYGYVGQFDQAEEGVAELSTARYLALLSEAKVRPEDQKARHQAIDALVGQPAGEFPDGATWLGGSPRTWKDLKGKIVILAFWAEWCVPCRNDLPELARLHQMRAANGLVLIGVHTPGSTPESIKKVMDEFHLDFPICVDTAPPDGVKAWGDLFGRYAVQAIPHAVAVDGQGTIVACGQLQDVLAKARESAGK